MNRYPKPFTVDAIIRREEKIDPKPAYQRGPVWTRKQKQLLIDTILRDLDIPKLYLRALRDGPYQFEVVDGQQRLRAIWEFFKDSYPLDREADPVNGLEVSGRKYSHLDEDIKDQFNGYQLDFIILEHAELEDVEEMFLRLQSGTTLKAAEKRNAMPGNMKYFIRNLAKHPFFESCAFSNRRYDYDHVAAQITLTELSGGPCNVKNTDLERMYKEHQDFDENGHQAQKIRKVLNFLKKCYPEQTPEIKRHSALSLYILASYLLEKYVIKEWAKNIRDWFIDFEKKRRDEEERPEDERDPELVVFQERTSRTTDAFDSIDYRHQYMLRDLLITYPDIQPLDDKRGFSHEQRIAIFRRDRGVCQLKLTCGGEKCDWDNWHADHVIPWTQGGKTVVGNGQVACPPCNEYKGAQVQS